jgi:hypothetical protein
MTQNNLIRNEKTHYIMRKAIINLIITVLLVVVPVIITCASAPPPPPPPGPGGGDAPIGGTAPIGSGVIMLISMGAAYGAKKVYNARKKLEE